MMLKNNMQETFLLLFDELNMTCDETLICFKSWDQLLNKIYLYALLIEELFLNEYELFWFGKWVWWIYYIYVVIILKIFLKWYLMI